MNWHTRSMVAHYPHDLKKKEVQQWDGCEHVVADPSLLYSISYENDSFGREGYCQCEECYRAVVAARDEEQKSCDDCYRIFTRKELTSWMAYDHNPRDGDRPLYLCVSCLTKDKHLQRIKDDRNAKIQEFGHDEDYFD